MGGNGNMFMNAPVDLELVDMTALAEADDKKAWFEGCGRHSVL